MLSSESALFSELIKRITSDVCCKLPGPDCPTATGVARPANQQQVAPAKSSSIFTCLTFLSFFWRSKSRRGLQENFDKPRALVYYQIKQLLKKLSKSEQQQLWKLIKLDGSHVGECILVNQTTTNTGCCQYDKVTDAEEDRLKCREQLPTTIPAQVLLCLIRWPPTQITCATVHSIHGSLRALPWCSQHHHLYTTSAVNESQNIMCINPYHWSLFTQQKDDYFVENAFKIRVPDQNALQYLVEDDPHKQQQYYSTPPPSYSEAFNSPSPLARCQADSTSTIQTDSTNQQEFHLKWGCVFYWERRERVGKPYELTEDVVNVYAKPIQGDGMSLHELFRTNQAHSSDIMKIRNKIGLGVCIFRDKDNSVWLYNRSTSSIYVSSLTLDPALFVRTNNVLNSVKKVAPGHLIKVYDMQVATTFRSSNLRPNTPGHDTFSFSFVKGFGPEYHKADIMQCPCWVEVILK